MRKEECIDIINSAGQKIKWRINWHYPFVRREVWVFGGICGLCGKWNWQWRLEESFCGATYACKECQNATNKSNK